MVNWERYSEVLGVGSEEEGRGEGKCMVVAEGGKGGKEGIIRGTDGESVIIARTRRDENQSRVQAA